MRESGRRGGNLGAEGHVSSVGGDNSVGDPLDVFPSLGLALDMG